MLSPLMPSGCVLPELCDTECGVGALISRQHLNSRVLPPYDLPFPRLILGIQNLCGLLSGFLKTSTCSVPSIVKQFQVDALSYGVGDQPLGIEVLEPKEVSQSHIIRVSLGTWCHSWGLSYSTFL